MGTLRPKEKEKEEKKEDNMPEQIFFGKEERRKGKEWLF